MVDALLDNNVFESKNSNDMNCVEIEASQSCRPLKPNSICVAFDLSEGTCDRGREGPERERKVAGEIVS